MYLIQDLRKIPLREWSGYLKWRIEEKFNRKPNGRTIIESSDSRGVFMLVSGGKPLSPFESWQLDDYFSRKYMGERIPVPKEFEDLEEYKWHYKYTDA